MKLLISLLGLLLIVEGLPYFAFPERMQAIMEEIQKMKPQQLRMVGLISTILGLILCYLAQRTNIFS